MEKGNIIREFGENYTCIPSDILQDGRVGLKSRGLYTTIFGLPKEWELSVQGLKTILKEGEKAIYAALKELEQYGYVSRSQPHTGTGFGKVVYTMHAHCVLAENVLAENVQAQNDVQYNNTTNKEYNNIDVGKPQKETLSLDFPMAEGYYSLMVTWVDYKRSIKHPYKTQIGLDRCYKQLYSLSNGNPSIAEQIINQSISNEYQGLFPLKNNQYGTNSNFSTRNHQRELETITRRAELLQSFGASEGADNITCAAISDL